MPDIENGIDYRTRADSYSDRSVWGVIVLNVASLVSISNIVANSPQPDQSLSALLIPSWLFVLGAASAGLGSLLQYRALRRESQAARQMRVYVEAVELVVSAGDEDRDHAYQKACEILSWATPRSLPAAGMPEERFDALSDAFQLRHEQGLRRSQVLETLSATALFGGIVLFLLAFATITWGTLHGVRLVNETVGNVPPAAGSVATASRSTAVLSNKGSSDEPKSRKVESSPPPSTAASHQ